MSAHKLRGDTEIERQPESAESSARQLSASTLAQRLRPIELQNYVVYLGFVLVLGFFSVYLGDTGFLTSDTLMNIVRQTTPVSIMAVGMAFALSAGEIDLSIGAVVALAALVTAIVLRQGSMLAAIPAGMGVGVSVGLVNGLITTKIRIPSFLVTLGTLSIITGLAQTVTDLQAVPILNSTYNFLFGSGSVGAISTLFLWTGAVLLLGHAIYRHTRFGRHVLATGGNREAAISAGISVDRIKITVLIISASTAALAGVLYAGGPHGAPDTLRGGELFTVI